MVEAGVPKTIDVAAALVFRAGKLLITKRCEHVHLGGLWEFPGGKRHPGETFEGCLVRELEEELGIQVAVRDLLETIVHSYPEKSVRLKFYRCRLVKNEPRPLGCSELAWINREELHHFQFPAADAKLVERLLEEPAIWCSELDS
jgi:8-oxo-dGTP diphosphatase